MGTQSDLNLWAIWVCHLTPDRNVSNMNWGHLRLILPRAENLSHSVKPFLCNPANKDTYTQRQKVESEKKIIAEWEKQREYVTHSPTCERQALHIHLIRVNHAKSLGYAAVCVSNDGVAELTRCACVRLDVLNIYTQPRTAWPHFTNTVNIPAASLLTQYTSLTDQHCEHTSLLTQYTSLTDQHCEHTSLLTQYISLTDQHCEPVCACTGQAGSQLGGWYSSFFTQTRNPACYQSVTIIIIIIIIIVIVNCWCRWMPLSASLATCFITYTYYLHSESASSSSVGGPVIKHKIIIFFYLVCTLTDLQYQPLLLNQVNCFIYW